VARVARPAETWIIFATTLVNRVGTMVLPFLVLYLAQDLDIPHDAPVSRSASTASACRRPRRAGFDRLGPLRVMQFSLVLSGAILFVVPLARALPVVFGLILLWAITTEAVRPASLAAITSATPGAQRKAAIALDRLAINLGMSVGPAAGGFLATVSFTLLFTVDGATSIAGALLLTALLRKRSLPIEAERAAGVIPSTAVLRNSRMLTFMLAMFLVGIVFFQMVLPLYLVRELGSRLPFGLLRGEHRAHHLLEVPLSPRRRDGRTGNASCGALCSRFGLHSPLPRADRADGGRLT
jgi:hypothetical protein